jgi:SHS2 domain-containing protein
MALHGYDEVDHTADIALRVWGEDFQTLLTQAAEGLYALMGIVTLTGSSLDNTITLPQGNRETILVDFLTELLYLSEEGGLVLEDFTFDEDQDKISVRSTGRKILSQERAIKAVTFHNLNVEETATGVITTITFDV